MTNTDLLLTLTILCYVIRVSSPQLFDFRPEKFARERYMRSRIQTTARKLGFVDVLGKFDSLDFVAMASENNYPGEEHTVITKDGYRLRIHRIPGNPSKKKIIGKPVVFLQHGLLASSDSWILTKPECTLAYMLADAGWDVWLGNSRGNTYSRSHVRLSPDYNPEFWQFSFHEIALYDLPASIDYALNITRQSSLVYIGHSMGTSVSYILLSTKPEYNDKIRLVVSLAPVALWSSPPRPFIKFLIYNTEAIKSFLFGAKINEVLPLTAASTEFAKIVCADGSLFQEACVNLIYFTSGYNPEQFNVSGLSYVLSFYPAGTSTRTLLHFSQNINSGNFKMFDYGARENFFKYRQREAPSYNLSNIVAPVALLYGKGDAIVTPGNPVELSKRLPNVVTIEPIPDVNFSHLDFLFSRDVKELLNDRVMEIIQDSTGNHDNDVR